MTMHLRAVSASLLLLGALQGTAPSPAEVQQGAGAPSAAERALAEALAAGGVDVDFAARALSIEAAVLIKGDLLEYLLVGPGGAAHESLFLTEVTPSVLNAGMLALGVEKGTNATWEGVEPAPTLEERRKGKQPFRVVPPSGDGFYIYAAWREGGQVYYYRVDDLIANLKTGRSMVRHVWVFLGSTFIEPGPGKDEVFAADLEQNLVNLTFFREGHTLATAALPDCEDQSIWAANPWLLPEREARVRLIFARGPLAELPAAWAAGLPVVAAPEEPAEGTGGG
jgi:hypothetical protein